MLLFNFFKVRDVFHSRYGISGSANDSTVSVHTAAVIINIDTLLGVYFVRGSLIFVNITYVALGIALKRAFSDVAKFAELQAHYKRQLSLRALRELNQRHQVTTIYAEEMDDIFALPVFMW